MIHGRDARAAEFFVLDREVLQRRLAVALWRELFRESGLTPDCQHPLVINRCEEQRAQHLPRGYLCKLCAACRVELPIISALNFPLHSCGIDGAEDQRVVGLA